MVVWNWSADVWGAASLHMIPGETGILSKFVSGFWRIVCTQRNLSTDHVETHLNLTCLHAGVAPWGKANPFSRCSGIDLTLECWEDLCQMASVLHPLIGKSRKSGSFLRWLRKSILQLCQPLMRVLIGREAICQFGVASWSFHPGSWPIWVKWMLDAKIRGAIWMLDWNKSYQLWPLWLQRWFHLWRSKAQIWLREVNWWCVHFQERVLWWPHQAKQRKDSWTESSPEMGEVVFSCRALGHSWYVLCWSISRSCWGLTGPVYIFCVGNYDLCELGRRRRLEIGCFLQLVPVLLITGCRESGSLHVTGFYYEKMSSWGVLFCFVHFSRDPE